LELAGRFREIVLRHVPEFQKRKDFYQRFVSLGPRQGAFDCPMDATPEEWLEHYGRLPAISGGSE